MYIIYGIANCDTVKKVLTFLKENTISYEFHDYKKKGISEEKLEEWLKQYPWEKLVNKAGTTWKKLAEEEKATDSISAIALMRSKTSVIKRPIVELNNKIIGIGFNMENYEKLLATK